MPTNRRKVLAIALIVFAASHDAQAQDVQRVDVREAGLVGHFYAASGASGRTGLLMLTGSGGGYPDDAAARDLARAGYPVLALAYFRETAKVIPQNSNRSSCGMCRWNTYSRRSIGWRLVRKSVPT